MYECLKCKGDISDLINWDYMGQTIECPHCGNEMSVNYDDCYDFETNEEYPRWWVEQE